MDTLPTCRAVRRAEYQAHGARCLSQKQMHAVEKRRKPLSSLSGALRARLSIVVGECARAREGPAKKCGMRARAVRGVVCGPRTLLHFALGECVGGGVVSWASGKDIREGDWTGHVAGSHDSGRLLLLRKHARGEGRVSVEKPASHVCCVVRERRGRRRVDARRYSGYIANGTSLSACHHQRHGPHTAASHVDSMAIENLDVSREREWTGEQQG